MIGRFLLTAKGPARVREICQLAFLPSCSYSAAVPESKPKVQQAEPESSLDNDDHKNVNSKHQADDSKSASSSKRKLSDQDDQFERADDQIATREKKSFMSKFFAGIKAKVDHELVKPVPSQYAHSIVKGLVVNQIDPAMLVYPEYDESSDILEAEGFAQHVERLITSNLDSRQCDKNKNIPASFVKECGDLGLFGLHIPKQYGGRGVNYKFLTRCYEELGRDWSLYTLISAHNDLAAKAIELFGTESQKSEYLPRLASGRSLGAFCLHEDACGQDVAALESTVTYAGPDSSSGFILTGEKSWITNAVNADVLIVFAKLKETGDRKNVPTTAFIVDRKNVIGIEDVNRKDTIGLRGVNISSLRFNHVKLPPRSILGIEERGFEIALKTASANRFMFAAAAAGCLKRNLSRIVQHCNATKRWGVMLADSNTIKARVAKIGYNIFALETMAYYMAGWLDDDPSKDFSVESAAAVRFARRALNECIFSMIEIMGADARTTEMDLERLLRDVVTLSGCWSTNDVYSGYIANEAFKVFAAEHSVTLYKAKNVLHFPMHTAKDKLKRQELYDDNVKLQHYINEHVHPSLELSCRAIEDAMAKFEEIFKSVVYSTGREIEDETIVLERVTDILTNMFVMLTAISRASRSYCIGLRNSDKELVTAEALCLDLRIKTLHLLAEMLRIDCPNTIDLYVKEMGATLMQFRGYLLERPTEKNW